MTNEQYIADLRSRCKDKSDHEFVDAMETIITEFERPIEPINPFEGMIIDHTSELGKAWDKAISDYCKDMGYKIAKK